MVAEKFALTALVFAVCLGIVVSYPSGPPAEASTCSNMIPGGSSPHTAQDGNGTYVLTVVGLTTSNDLGFFTYSAGTTYTGMITSTDGMDILGYLVQAVDPSRARIGQFGTVADQQKHLACNSIRPDIADSATLVHSMRNSGSVTFTWTSPMGGDGMVDFRFTIVRDRNQYFGPLSAGGPNGAVIESVPEPSVKTVPTRNPANYRITARNPAGCAVEDCSVFVGVDTNVFDSRFLDIYLEGDARAWVAVGFTESPSMFGADVVGCNLRNTATNQVEVLDTWNPKGERDNSADALNNAFLFNGSFVDGRLRCYIGRQITTVGDDNNDLNLNASLYLLYGFSNDQASGALRSHRLGLRDTPQVSPSRVNPAMDTANFTPERVRSALTRLHGILMWLSWPVMGITGMFFAFFMRPALPNGEWFQAHRALMVLSLFTGLLGFFFIFVAQYRRQPNQGLINFNTNAHIAHFVFGVIAMLMQIVNPLIALCRCKPDSKNRWIFNCVHGYGIGIWSIMVSLTTVGLGCGIFNTEVSSLGPSLNLFWVFVIYVVVYTCLVSIGYNILFWGIIPKIYGDQCSSDKKCSSGKKGSPNEHEMEQKGEEKPPLREGENPPRKPPSKDFKIRWIAFAVFSIFNFLIGLAMIVLIAF